MNRKYALLLTLVLSSPAALVAQQASTPEAPKMPPASAPQKEDWTVLSLDKSGLDTSLTGATTIGKWEQPEYTRELLHVEWRRGDPMDIYVIRPHGVARPPVILYLYDYRGDTDRYRDDGWCKRATKDGFAAVGLVSAVSGHRFHAPRPLKEWFVSELQEALASTAHDVQMTLNYLATRNDLDLSHVGMFGQGSGAAVAVLAAAADPRLFVLDLYEPWGDWPKWLKDSPLIPDKDRADYLKPEFLSTVDNLDPVKYLPQLTSRHVRIEFLMTDPETAVSSRDSIIAGAPKGIEVVQYRTPDDHIKAWHANGLAGWIEAQIRKENEPASKAGMMVAAAPQSKQ